MFHLKMIMKNKSFQIGLLSILLPLVIASQSPDCSSNQVCVCTQIDKYNFKADCSGKNISEIPIFTEAVLEIDLSRNEKLTIIRENNSLPSQLIRLDLSSCNLQSIELGVFQYLKKLTYLDISWNMELTLGVLPNITNDLIGSDIKTLKFNAIQCSVGAGITLQYEHLCRLHNTSLQAIEMSKNRIDMVEQFTIQNLPPTLMNISVGHNQLRFGLYFLEANSMANLRYLNLDDMYLLDNPFENPLSVTCKDYDKFKSNSVRTQAGLVPCPNEHTVSKSSLHDSKLIMHMPPKLETMVGNNCIVRFTEKLSNLVLKFYSLRVARVNNNFLQYLYGTDYSQKLQEGYFSNCFIKDIDNLFFETSNLTILDLSQNLLGKYFSTNTSAKQLARQKYLKILNLSYNRLHHAPHDLFHGLTRLEVLNISNTEVTKIHFKLDSLVSLKTLDLTNNRIQTFTEHNMKVFDELSEGSFISINLIGNDISCNCDTLKFLTWMQRKERMGSRIRFMNFEKYSCFSANSRQKNFINISEIILELQKNCSSKTAVFVISGFVLVLFIVIVIAGILYRYRWKLRYIYHMTRRSLRGYFLLQNHDGSEIKCFEFDAFVSYAEEDAHFAHDTLKSKVLSKYPSAKLCYHKEHFLPGRSIPESIVNAVNCSRKTVCVLSEHFLASEWCIYEFKMANLEKIYKRCDQNSLLVLKFGNVNLDSLPSDIMIYLKSRSYMEIPYNIDDSDGFWDLIVNAIIEE